MIIFWGEKQHVNFGNYKSKNSLGTGLGHLIIISHQKNFDYSTWSSAELDYGRNRPEQPVQWGNFEKANRDNHATSICLRQGDSQGSSVGDRISENVIVEMILSALDDQRSEKHGERGQKPPQVRGSTHGDWWLIFELASARSVVTASIVQQSHS